LLEISDFVAARLRYKSHTKNQGILDLLKNIYIWEAAQEVQGKSEVF